jgi:hypothetical protein
MDNKINHKIDIVVNEIININPLEYIRIYCVDTGLYVYSAFMEDLRKPNISILLECNSENQNITLSINNLIVHSRKVSSTPSNINNLYQIIYQ